MCHHCVLSAVDFLIASFSSDDFFSSSYSSSPFRSVSRYSFSFVIIFIVFFVSFIFFSSSLFSFSAPSHFLHRFLLLWLLYNALKMSKDLCVCLCAARWLNGAVALHQIFTFNKRTRLFCCCCCCCDCIQHRASYITETDINFSFDIISQ